jgi:hypothetical protein
VGDFNGDGKDDLVFVEQDSSQVNVFLSNGDGTFKPWSQVWGVLIPPNPLMLVLDLTGDGADDIVLIRPNQGGADIRLTNRDGTFTGSMFYPYVGDPTPLAEGTFLVGDFNGDGKQDLAHILPQPLLGGLASMYVWFSKGDGTFEVVPFDQMNDPPTNGPWFAGDFNGDGVDDIIQIVTAANLVNTWISQSDGTFNPWPYHAWSGYPMPGGNWLLGDIDGDGTTDLVHLVPNVAYFYTWRSQLAVVLNAQIVDLQTDTFVNGLEGPGP